MIILIKSSGNFNFKAGDLKYTDISQETLSLNSNTSTTSTIVNSSKYDLNIQNRFELLLLLFHKNSERELKLQL